MIHYRKGNIFDSEAEALVNTVNLLGIMGKGIALQSKKLYPNNFIAYKKACKEGQIAIGKLFIYREVSICGEKIIVNFPTKIDWRKPSELIYIEEGLKNLKDVIVSNNIKSIAIPPLGAGNGGLNWMNVRPLIERYLSPLEIDIYIYEPTNDIKEQMKSERVKLTDGRALLLYVLFDLVRQGEYVSEFSSEKICYFLQKFGARDIFKLDYTPKFYGPYSGKVRYVLNYLNGSYIMGYSDMNKRPFEQLSLVPDGYETVKTYIDCNLALKEIATKTIAFLSGFYSDFGLELLSSVDYILDKHGKELSIEEIYNHLKSWTDRKAKMFSEIRFIEIAKDHITGF